MENLKEFLSVSSGSGFGDGYSSGDGDGSGDGSGYGSGDGSGFGYSFGDGSGDGSGFGYSFGDGSGYCSGDGDGSGVKSIDSEKVYQIDGVPTIIKNLHNNVAKGFILNSDLSLSPCYVVKHNNSFAHGETLAEARKALNDKLFEDMDEEERVQMFLEKFELNKKYSAKDFFDWHNKLTGSCEMGRKAFCKNHSINIDTDELTVQEFIDICIDDYGNEVIKLLKQKINETEE